MAPNPVTNLGLGTYSDWWFNINFNNPASGTWVGFELFLNNVATGVRWTTSGAKTIAYPTPPVQSSTTYTVHVKSYDGAMVYSSSNPSVVVTTSALAAPYNLAAGTRTETTIPLSWQDNSEPDVTYDIKDYGSNVKTGITGVSTTMTGLAENSQHSYQVVKHDPANPSKTSTSNTLVVSTTSVAPAKPATSYSTVTATSILFHFNSSADVVGYDIWFGNPTTYQGYYAGIASKQFTGLQPNKSYSFQVVAYDGAGNQSPISDNLVATTTADTTAPNKPVAPTIGTITSTSVALSWPLGSDNVTAGNNLTYLVFVNGVQKAGGVNLTSTVITGLTPGTVYDFQIQLIDEALNYSAMSDISKATTLPAVHSPGSVLLFG